MKTAFELIEEHGLTLHGDIEHFAELVRADERKAVLQLIKEVRPAIKPMDVMGKDMTTQEWFDVLVAAIEESDKCTNIVFFERGNT